MQGHGRSRRDARPQGSRARRGLRAGAVRRLATALLVTAAALAAAAPAHAQDALCTGEYGAGAAQPGPPLRFGIDSELAGSVGAGQGAAAPLDWAKDRAALKRLTPPGKQMVLRVNRLFWADGDAAIKRFRAIVDKHAAAGFDSELQVRYHPAAGDEGDIEAWQAYVRKVVRMLGADRHVVSLTITNEVNLAISQNTSDGAYEKATEALIKGIVAARAEADRIGRTDLPVGFTYAYRWNPQSDAAFFTALAAGGDAFRSALGFVGLDVYPGTFYPPVISPPSSPGQEVVKAIATLRECFMPKGLLAPTVPIWITENGFQSGATSDDAGQAEGLRDMIGSIAAVSGTYNVTDYRWFNLRDNVTGDPGLFNTAGLLRDDYSEKPSLQAYRAVVAQHGAAKPPSCVSQVSIRLPKGARRYVARLDGRRVPGRRHGRRVTIVFKRAGMREVSITSRGRTILRTVLACGPARASAKKSKRRPTFVTLEFDVATADQTRAMPILRAHDMHGTFFVNSGLIGRPGHLSWSQLRHMQAIGHEIAGQTISHAKLTELAPEQVRHQVCDDRSALLGHGLAADAFAYPYGAYSGAVRDVVVSCGYTSARLASGIAGAGKVCVGCPYAESIPPHSPFATRMPAGVQRTSTLARLTRAVRDAQSHGGGWVQILIHHVCDRCHRYAITPSALRRLAAWLARRQGVQVRTVSQLLDIAGPSVVVSAPGGAHAAGRVVTFPVRFRAPAGVRRVRFFVDGRQVGMRTIAPWRLRWIPTGVKPGRHDLRALLEDARGNAAVSRQTSFVTR
ncbi:MAG: polysaccharide deacetylase family protein [Solirubrobacteraceae bacterium]